MAGLWYRLMGAHLSPKCHVGGRLRELDLLRMDRFSGTEETLSCASLEEGELRLGEVHLQRGAWVGAGCAVAPWTVVPECTRLDDMASVERAPVLVGCPAVAEEWRAGACLERVPGDQGAPGPGLRHRLAGPAGRPHRA